MSDDDTQADLEAEFRRGFDEARAEDEPLVTKTGKELAEADIDALAREADIGYQLDEEGKWHSTEHTLLATTDAMTWASEFVRIFGGATVNEEVDEGLMVSWFAAAIETGRNFGRKETCPHTDTFMIENLMNCRTCGSVFDGGVPG